MGFNSSLGIGWPVSSYTGWGIYGLNLTQQLLEMKRNPVWVSAPVDIELDDAFLSIAKKQTLLEEVAAKTGCLEFDFPVLHALRNDFRPSLDEQLAQGSKNIGVIFFENTEFSKLGLKRAHDYDLIVTGSSWNMNLLKKRGLPNVVNVFQGVDTDLFSPVYKSKQDPKRFIIFSGGKFEYRKGQDAVVSAFKQFYANHPNALLVFAWENPWVEIVSTIKNSKLVEGVPEKTKYGVTDFSSWLNRNGLPNESFQDLGRVPNHKMPSVLASADVAIFPNRCEAGTNLVAMEAMASGLPTILSSNTGHLDLIKQGNCIPLLKMSPSRPFAHYSGVSGWMEPDVDEMVDALEKVYENGKEISQVAKMGHETLQYFNWKKQVESLIDIIDTRFLKPDVYG